MDTPMDGEADQLAVVGKGPSAIMNGLLSMELSMDDYRQLWHPWKKKALIIKVLKISLTYRVLEQRIRDLQKSKLCLKWRIRT